MKKILALFAVVVLTGCYKRGEIASHPTDFISIHGKVYKLIAIAPEDGERPIWIMYPKDSADSMPTVLNYEFHQGKSTYTETVIKVD